MAIRTFQNDGKTLLRFVAFSSFSIKGSYRYKDVLQIMSLPEEAPKPQYAIGEYPLVIEYMYNPIGKKELERTLSEYPNPDSFDERILESRYDFTKQDEILCVLSVITKYVISKEENGRRWVLCDTDRDWISVERNVGYFWKGLSQFGGELTDIDIDCIPEIQFEQYYSKEAFLGEPFMISDSTSLLLDKYFLLDEARKEAFLSACVLFERSSRTWAISHSLAYIGFVSGIEALIVYENKDVKIEKCDDCGQEKYKVTQKFLAFSRDYGNDSPEFKKYVKKLYERRSLIGHAGKLLSHDMVGRISGPVVEMNDGIELRNLQRVVRIMMINWLAKV
ncbi:MULTISPECIES: hypothetical protein [unclassified Sulfuricurvum]|uniref:hypothetical protein n=1 Tax=unclassified Sulfuricurvum TaxID=2632390 RepID=UPI0002997A4C|nr:MULTISPECIES: hypothetical protein [unclassified Sulfuricurvum]AFV97920.1 hypothetical protein B649_08040 [Candidatus Sulfuricurvum sp. RIFRC-1]HBM35535.1 hypothetical protein [Sulfuricurvum sp.]